MRSETNGKGPRMATAETHVPPQNLEAESSVLGAMMVSDGAIAPVILDVRLHDEDFYRERHRIVFRAITGLYEQGELAGDFRSVAEVLSDEIDRLEKLATGDQDITGTPSGFRDLDAKLGGFQPGNLIVIAARPSLGKSALVCNIADNVASKYGKAVAFFSLEMSEAELAHRFISCRSRIPNDKLRKGNVSTRDWPRVVRACNELENIPLWLDDSSDLSLLELRAKARRLAASEGNLGLVIVDYLQLMRAEDPRANRVEQVGQFSRGMKILARELDVPVIALSQLSRAPEQRPGGKPMLSDLRESGSIEQDSDVVVFIYRASKYDEDADPSEADLIIAKHRNGPTGDVPVVFLEQYPRFVDRARGAEPGIEQKSVEGPPLMDVADDFADGA